MDKATAAACFLSVAVLAGGCAPATEHHRLDFRVQADGSCLLREQPLPCQEAGRQALAIYPAERISAVLFVDPAAPVKSAQQLRASLLEARVTHIQLGDTAHQSYQAAKGVQF